MNINPKMLKKKLSERSMTQADLARRAGLAEKTIGRISRGKGSNRATTEKIAKVFGIDAQALCEAPVQEPKDSTGDSHEGYPLYRMVVDLDAQTLNNLETASWRYGLPAKSILQYAPLLFSIVAELSLTRRKQEVQGFTSISLEQFATAPLSLREYVETAREALNAQVDKEYESVSARKLGGQQPTEYWSDNYHEGQDVFLQFLEVLAGEAGHDLDFFGCTLEDLSCYIFSPIEMWAITKHADCSDYYLNLAEHALNEGQVLLRYMPKTLFADDEAEGRVMWLASHYGGAKGDIGRVDGFFTQIDLSDLNKANSPEADSPKLQACNAVSNGSASLSEIPEELFAPERANECVLWVAKHFGGDDDA